MALTTFSEQPEILAHGACLAMEGSGVQIINAEMNDWFGSQADVFVGKGLECQACVGGVVLDPDEIDRYMRLCGVADSRVIYYYVLGHERTHLSQVDEAGGPGQFMASYAHEPIAQILELVADFVAGLFLGKSLLEHDIDFLKLPPFARVIGNSSWPKGFHPAPEQRVQAIMRGLNVGAVWLQQETEVPCADARSMGLQLARQLQGGLRASGFYRF